MVTVVIIHLEVDPKKCSYTFLYEIATFETDPNNLTEIFNTIAKYKLRPSDCEDVADREPYGVLSALAKNPNTEYDIIKKISQSEDECLRSWVAEYTKFDDIIEWLLDDRYTIVLTDALKNRHLKRKHFLKLFNRFINNEIDFEMLANREHITPAQFARKLSKHRFATMTEVIALGK